MGLLGDWNNLLGVTFAVDEILVGVSGIYVSAIQAIPDNQVFVIDRHDVSVIRAHNYTLDASPYHRTGYYAASVTVRG